MRKYDASEFHSGVVTMRNLHVAYAKACAVYTANPEGDYNIPSSEWVKRLNGEEEKKDV